MEHERSAAAFSTLGHSGRLAVFRLLVRFAPKGARPTEMAEALQIKPNTLSHHLSELSSAGLIQAQRQGRSLIYSVDLAAMAGLIGYLFADVGRGRPDLLPLGASDPARRAPIESRRYNVLFICSGNSARSLFAEALLRDLGADRFNAYSAGARPASRPNPLALQVLARNGHQTSTLQSKHIALFQAPSAPVMDFVFTVCDAAAAEECPPWPGQPISGHWGLRDPVAAGGTDAEKALVFAQTYAALRRRIGAFAALPFASLDRKSLQSRIDLIGAESAFKERN